jgi:predicted HicB family RNase H-like nuclease
MISMRTGRPRTGRQPVISIRINPDIYHKAKVAAVTGKMTIGRWLEEAINEKADREKPGRRDE